MPERAATLQRRVREHLAVAEALAQEPLAGAVLAAAEALAGSLAGGGKALLFGNGGSAADAQHLAAELVGRYGFERPALPALSLAANPSAVTALGNDYGFAEVFARQVEALGRPGDIAVGISTSGRSENVVRGLAAARRLGLVTVALTGSAPGPVGAAADHVLAMPSTATPRIQEAHILCGHILCELAERALHPEAS